MTQVSHWVVGPLKKKKRVIVVMSMNRLIAIGYYCKRMQYHRLQLLFISFINKQNVIIPCNSQRENNGREQAFLFSPLKKIILV